MMSKKRVLGQRQKERGVALNVPDFLGLKNQKKRTDHIKY